MSGSIVRSMAALLLLCVTESAWAAATVPCALTFKKAAEEFRSADHVLRAVIKESIVSQEESAPAADVAQKQSAEAVRSSVARIQAAEGNRPLPNAQEVSGLGAAGEPFFYFVDVVGLRSSEAVNGLNPQNPEIKGGSEALKFAHHPDRIPDAIRRDPKYEGALKRLKSLNETMTVVDRLMGDTGRFFKWATGFALKIRQRAARVGVNHPDRPAKLLLRDALLTEIMEQAKEIGLGKVAVDGMTEVPLLNVFGPREGISFDRRFSYLLNEGAGFIDAANRDLRPDGVSQNPHTEFGHLLQLLYLGQAIRATGGHLKNRPMESILKDLAMLSPHDTFLGNAFYKRGSFSHVTPVLSFTETRTRQDLERPHDYSKDGVSPWYVQFDNFVTDGGPGRPVAPARPEAAGGAFLHRILEHAALNGELIPLEELSALVSKEAPEFRVLNDTGKLVGIVRLFSR